LFCEGSVDDMGIICSLVLVFPPHPR